MGDTAGRLNSMLCMNRSSQVGPLPREQALHYRNELRTARAAASADAEGFKELLFALERIGMALIGKIGDLGKYRAAFVEVAAASSLSTDIPRDFPQWHSDFAALFEAVRDGRNDALHQGAFARTLTNHAILLALALEDALMAKLSTVSDFMVRNVSVASAWQPVSFIRQQMLLNAFSYMPVHVTRGGGAGWQLISEFAVAKYLRRGATDEQRKRRLATKVEDAAKSQELTFVPALTTRPETPVTEVILKLSAEPILVMDEERNDTIVGILTASDLL